MSSLTLRRPTPSLTLEIPKSSRRFPSSFSSPSLPSDRFSPFGLDSSYFDSISPVKRSQVQIREEVEETSHSFKRPIPNLPPSPTRGLPKQANDQLSSPKNKKEQEPNELPPFEDEVSALIKTELLIASLKQRRQLGEGQPAWVDFEPRLVKSLAVGIFLVNFNLTRLRTLAYLQTTHLLIFDHLDVFSQPQLTSQLHSTRTSSIITLCSCL